MIDEIDIENIKYYYEGKLDSFGVTPKGVDWNSKDSQELRFSQLLKVLENQNKVSVLDYGCGYGALAKYLAEKVDKFTYVGFDISEKMIEVANELNREIPDIKFISDESKIVSVDFTLASGIFNVKLDVSNNIWKSYIIDSLNHFTRISSKGFAFNALTNYSDREKMRPDLYYSDPLFLFDYCKKNISPFVSLLHDYPLYEFTILVRKEDEQWQIL